MPDPATLLDSRIEMIMRCEIPTPDGPVVCFFCIMKACQEAWTWKSRKCGLRIRVPDIATRVPLKSRMDGENTETPVFGRAPRSRFPEVCSSAVEGHWVVLAPSTEVALLGAYITHHTQRQRWRVVCALEGARARCRSRRSSCLA